MFSILVISGKMYGDRFIETDGRIIEITTEENSEDDYSYKENGEIKV